MQEYQNSLIELIQGFSLYTNKTVEKDKNYNGWVTDKPDPIYDGLEILKMFMLDSSQMYELHSSRTLTIKKAEKKRKKLLKKKLKEQGLTIKNLKKEFKLFHSNKDRLLNIVPLINKKFDMHTSLDNISFDVKKGEFVSIIGKNGSGKSTLNNIISKELLGVYINPDEIEKEIKQFDFLDLLSPSAIFEMTHLGMLLLISPASSINLVLISYSRAFQAR